MITGRPGFADIAAPPASEPECTVRDRPPRFEARAGAEEARLFLGDRLHANLRDVTGGRVSSRAAASVRSRWGAAFSSTPHWCRQGELGYPCAASLRKHAGFGSSPAADGIELMGSHDSARNRE